jgi:hypothetical protein
MVGIVLTATPGCSGCRQDSDQRLADKIKAEQRRQKKKKPKPNFRSPGTMILPGKYPDLAGKTAEELKEMSPEERSIYLRNQFTRINRTKTGHWLETSTPTIANNFNQEGQIESVPIKGMGPAVIPGTHYQLATSRSFSLVKGQWKFLRSTVFLPNLGETQNVNLNVGLSVASGGVPFYAVPLAFSQTMAGFQYHMVVLSNRPAQMRYLQFTDSVQVRQNNFSSTDTPPFYIVVANEPDQPVPLPSNVLNWTTMAYLVWDDLDADQLSPDQQQSLIDWIHFGGQLILSGPDCLSKLESSFLADYLPAQSAGKTELNSIAFEPLNENWSVPNRNNPAERRSLLITAGNPIVGIEFKPHVDSNFIPGVGSLTIERSIGRGRVVATAFSLTSPAVKSWGSFQSFFNNALLRKPRRQFRSRNETVSFNWVDDGSSIYDPLMGSTVRFISRDLSAQGTPEDPQPEIRLQNGFLDPASDLILSNGDQPEELDPGQHRQLRGLKRNLTDTQRYGGYASDPFSGVGGWSDDSAIARSARSGLKAAAGISPPSANLILKMLGVYLLVLVPANWLLFRMIGKVEWAWAAIPVIAIAGAVTVVKIASLDIGFARSNTQVALLELHHGYHRGHLSQYSALYTSLSTNYAVELDNATGIAIPLSNGREHKAGLNTQPQRLTLQQSLTNRTENFQIQSNSTGLLHAQWFQDIGGSIEIGTHNRSLDFTRLDITNSSTLSLTSVGVIARDTDGQYAAGWLGDLPAANSNSDQTVEVNLERCNKFELPDLWTTPSGLIHPLNSPKQLISRLKLDTNNRIPVDQIRSMPVLEPYWDTFSQLAQSADGQPEPSISRSQFLSTLSQAKTDNNVHNPPSLAGNLLREVLENLELGKGEIRLLGASDQPIGQTRLDPQSTQTVHQTLVVVHLRQPSLKPIQRDVNSILDFTQTRSNLGAPNDLEDDLSDEYFDGTIEQE